MGKVLLAIASRREFQAIFPRLSAAAATAASLQINENLEVAICGVGILEFSSNLSYLLSRNSYGMVIQLGICGAYPNRGLNLCDVVRVDTDVVGDMGVLDREGHFTSWGDFTGEDQTIQGGDVSLLPKPLASFPAVAGVTVNCCTGTRYLSLRRGGLFHAAVESMEGAAVFAVCRRFGIPAFQIRSVSNIATDRDESKWKVSEALEALKTQVVGALL